MNDKLVYGFDITFGRDRLAQLLNESTSKYKILQQHLDEKEIFCLELSRKNEDLIFNRENLQKTIRREVKKY